LGVVSKRANVVGAIAGVLVGIAIIVWMSLSQLFLGEDALANQFHTYLTIVFGTTAIFLVGFLVSMFVSNKRKDVPGSAK
jgi:SSS family solute:Na+ symporter